MGAFKDSLNDRLAADFRKDSVSSTGAGGSALVGAGRCGGGMDVRCDEPGRACRRILLFCDGAIECEVLVVLTLITEETDVRLENDGSVET